MGGVRAWRRRHEVVQGFLGAGVAALFGVLSIGMAVGEGVGPYYGDFEEARFREAALDAERSPAPAVVEGLLGEAGVAVLYLKTGSGAATWVVHADGRVLLFGDASWPDARDAFVRWFAGLGVGEPSFEGLRVTTERAALERSSALL